MTHEELKALLDGVIAKDNTAYEQVILPAVMDSKMSRERILTAALKSAKINMCKTQLCWIRERDGEIRALKLMEKESEERIRQWKAAGEKIYSVDDFPEWLIGNLNNKFGSANSAVYEVSARLMQVKPDYFAMKCLQNVPKCYALVDGKAFFNEDGYKYLVMESVGNDWVTSEEHKQWIRDKKDLYPGAII